MNVNLGSIEVDDQTCRLIRRSTFGISGRATRKEIKAWALKTLGEEIAVMMEVEGLPLDGSESLASTEGPDDAEDDEVFSVIDLGEYVAAHG